MYGRFSTVMRNIGKKVFAFSVFFLYLVIANGAGRLFGPEGFALPTHRVYAYSLAVCIVSGLSLYHVAHDMIFWLEDDDGYLETKTYDQLWREINGGK